MNTRVAEYPINEIFLNRWSPRTMSGEPLSHKELMSLFEAARWAPSSFNSQPWRFIYAHRDTQYWKKLFDLLVEFNQSWCKNAAVLVLMISKKTFDNGKPARTHSFDTGSAWENLALQGSLNKLVVHGMSGFRYKKARDVFSIPEEYAIEAMCAIGKPGSTKDLPSELQERETKSDRKPVSTFVCEGAFTPSELQDDQ